MVDQECCPRCGATLSPGDGCRRCLLALGLGVAVPSQESRPSLGPSAETSHEMPERVGHFRILDALAVGDTSVTYLAEAEPEGRRVALRVVDPRPDAQEILARFEAGREVLAGASHPGLVSPIDAGVSEEGRPWWATEWVPGVPVTEYCDRRRLAVRQRLELLVEACDAIEHAHTRGLLHLNIKPSKLLVTEDEGRPRVRVIDCGVARALDQKLTEASLYTARGLLGTTPAYMSPEQAGSPSRGVDARSDIYSLGVLLYELLVGAAPFESRRLRQASWAEMVRIIQEEAPPRPSARVVTLGGGHPSEAAMARRTEARRLARELSGDLDWIVLKALQKDPSRRYPSAQGVGLDIRRTLAGEPVAPGLRSIAHRLRRALRL